jgi:3-oxoacyl-[acyl-carrier protein] reductase
VNLGLKGKVALVAASSKGLGRAVADEMGAEGASLIMCARETGPLDEAKRAIAEACDVDVLAVTADLSDPAQVDRLVSEGLDHFGRIDILVTNTGGPPAGPFEDHSREVWHDAVRQNLDSVVNLTRAVLPGMKERRWGRILNITSIAVKQPVDGLMLSNSIRAAVTGFARTLANEVGSFGITVNNVMPGYTTTERLDELAQRIAETKGISVAEAKAAWEGEVPMARLAEPPELGALVTFLASERAGYITATSIPVDGGWIRALL